MEFDAEVPYGHGKAIFRISKENLGIYCASLLHFDGDEQHSPPMQITLIRGIRGWTGSESDEVLINMLGNLIETHLLKQHRTQGLKK